MTELLYEASSLIERGAHAIVELKRLPDGTFAPKGRGQILRPGMKVKLPGVQQAEPGMGTKAATATISAVGAETSEGQSMKPEQIEVKLGDEHHVIPIDLSSAKLATGNQHGYATEQPSAEKPYQNEPHDPAKRENTRHYQTRPHDPTGKKSGRQIDPGQPAGGVDSPDKTKGKVYKPSGKKVGSGKPPAKKTTSTEKGPWDGPPKKKRSSKTPPGEPQTVDSMNTAVEKARAKSGWTPKEPQSPGTSDDHQQSLGSPHIKSKPHKKSKTQMDAGNSGEGLEDILKKSVEQQKKKNAAKKTLPTTAAPKGDGSLKSNAKLATAGAKKSKEGSVSLSKLGVGDHFEKDGEHYAVIEVDPDGYRISQRQDIDVSELDADSQTEAFGDIEVKRLTPSYSEAFEKAKGKKAEPSYEDEQIAAGIPKEELTKNAASNPDAVAAQNALDAYTKAGGTDQAIIAIMKAKAEAGAQPGSPAAEMDAAQKQIDTEPDAADPAEGGEGEAEGGLQPNTDAVDIGHMQPGQQFEMLDGSQWVYHKPVNPPFHIVKPLDGGKAKPLHEKYAPAKIAPAGGEATPSAPDAAAPGEDDLYDTLSKSVAQVKAENAMKGVDTSPTKGEGYHDGTELDGSPGRGPTGKLRNFNAMKPPKLKGIVAELEAFGKDPEALEKAKSALQYKGIWDKHSKPYS